MGWKESAQWHVSSKGWLGSLQAEFVGDGGGKN
jgi:hypothetical protein